MKTLLILIFSIAFTAQSQYISQRNYLACYGQVWGFLKYFHPETSNRDWDKVLLEDFERINNCTSDSSFNIILSDLVELCGALKPEARSIADSLKFTESYSWMDSEIIAPENKEAFKYLLENKPVFKNKYISDTPVGKPKITNEEDYGNYTYNPAIQYLALTRYWNVINYYCPNRDIIPNDWNAVYYSHLSNFINAKTYEDYYFAVSRITAEIRDGHGFIKTDNNPLLDYRFVPFYCVNLSDGCYISIIWQDSLQSYNLQRMDRLVEIDGVSIEEKFKQLSETISYSNEYYLSNSTYYLRLYNKDSVAITVERDGELISQKLPTIDKETVLARYKPKKSDVKPAPYSFLTDSISGKSYCYINMGKLERSDINRRFKKKLYKTDHIIIDSRNYPNWTVIELSKILIKGERKFATFKKMDFDYPGAYTWTESQTIGNDKTGYSGRIYVLVDYHTMSQAEYTVMALQQHPNTVVIGGQTAGADGNIADIPLPFGISSVFSGLGVFYPDRTPTQQVGVERDYKVVQDHSYLEGHDLILEKALELLRLN